MIKLIASINCVRIGSIKQAQILTNAPSFWLYNQSSWSQCFCYSLQYPPVVAFNNYPLNASCQLFSNLSLYEFKIISNSNMSVHLLQPLIKYAPCCSNLTWLLSQIQSRTISLNISSITSAALDPINNRIGIVATVGLRLVSTTSVTFSNISASLPTNARPLSYHQGLFYVGIFPVLVPYTLHIYSAANLTKVGNMSLSTGSPQRMIWLFNDTLMCILTQNGTSTGSMANFYNWPSITLNKSVSLGIQNAFGLGKSNDDSFVYIADGRSTGAIWQLQTLPPYNLSKFVPTATSTEAPVNIAIDGCNRLWAAINGFGVRIYDLQSGSLLKAWDTRPTYSGLYDIILTNQYELYLADMSASKLVRFGSAIQCTN